MRTGDAAEAFDFEAIFHAHYRRVARVIVRIIQDPSRAEELAVDVFCKLWRHPTAQGPHSAGWLYRVAARVAVDELRARARRERRERWFGIAPSGDPERARAVAEESTRIRIVLASLRAQDAQLIALRGGALVRGAGAVARVEACVGRNDAAASPRSLPKGVRETLWRRMTSSNDGCTGG
jgi:DNA-directed RNA polymerase specialized sigma24 family protein